VRSKRHHCATVSDETPIKRPDLAIYSQRQIWANGSPPSWDSPDILTNAWRPFRLREEAEVKVRNLSLEAPAINAVVHYYLTEFGIGMRRVRMLSQQVNVGAGSEVNLVFPLHQSTLAGDPRAGVHIVIDHPHDTNRANNEGSQVHDGGYTTESGRQFTVQIPVLNDFPQPRRIALAVTSTPLIATVAPALRMYQPFEQVIATLTIEVPTALSGTAANPINTGATVIATLEDGTLIGGATRLVRVDD
jgi:hypothetical protein